MEADLSFGRWLQRRRKALDLTQAELGRRVGYARVTIHKIETDQLRPSRQMADKLAGELAIAPDQRDAFVRFARDDPRADPPPVLTPLPERFPGSGSSPRRHNLPVQTTRFIGRDKDVLVSCEMLRGDVRLLTLTGVGGIGKTRLALEVAWALVETCPDGVWFVDLASVADPDLIPRAVASVLNVRADPSQPLRTTLVTALRGRRLLLILDNCEHLVDACARLTEEILQASPNVRILATSREALRIAGEISRTVTPLVVPPPGESPTVDQLCQYEAVRLFAERAIAVQPGFAVTNQNAAAVVQICRGLDGIPLALELAAARVRVLSVEQIAARLDDRFRLLTGGSRTALRRHQALQATIEWSYDLLARGDRALLRMVSVFAGGWSLASCEAICAGKEIDRAEALDGLTALIDKSLVVVEEHGGEARYRLLETVRQYGWERLLEAGEASAARQRHLAWYLDLAEQAEPQLDGTKQQLWLKQLEDEHDNLRAALTWSLENDPVRGLRLAGCLAQFWRHGGHHAEGRRWLNAVLARENQANSQLTARARALLGAGNLAADAGDFGPGLVARAKESVQLFRDARDERGLAAALQHLGRCLLEQGQDAEQARQVFDESLRLAHTLGDQREIGKAFANLAYLTWCQGNHRGARKLYLSAIAHLRRSGDAMFTGLVLGALGWYCMVDGDLEPARRCKEESLAILRHLEAKEGVGLALLGLAHLARQESDVARLRSYLEESAPLLRETGSPGASDWLTFVGQVCVERRDYSRGVRLLAAGDTEGPRAGSLRALFYFMPRAELDACLLTAKSALGEAAFQAAWAEGQAMTLEQAFSEALSPPSLAISPAPRPASRGALDLPLTPREKTVALLVGTGLTNRQIAAALVITSRTADTHVTNILTKLGLHSRAQVAAWAVKHGLLAEDT